jgi:hypothetical protein
VNATTRYDADGLVVHPDALRAVAMFMSQDESSQRMRCVFIDEEGHLSATNGHALIRLASIDPNGYVPKDRAGTRWSPEYAEQVVKSCRVRGHARDACRVKLEWSGAETSKIVPNTVRVINANLCEKPDGEQWAIAARYARLLGEVSEILLGKIGSTMKGPILTHVGKCDTAKMWEIPWHSDEPKPDQGMWVHGRGEGKPAPYEEPRCSSEVMIMPVRL